MSRLSQVQTVFTADDSRLQTAIRANISSLRGFGTRLTAFSRIGVLAFAAVGSAAASIALGRKFVKMAEDQEKADRKLATSLMASGNATGFTFKQLQQMSAELQRVTEFEDNAVEGAEAMLAGFTNIRADVFKRALLGAMDMASFLDEDLLTAAESVGKALNNPADAFTRLTRAGIQFTDAEKAVIKQMLTVGDVAGAQNAILDKMATRFGGQASAAAQTFSGKISIMKHEVGEAGETLGFALLPAVEALLEPLAALAGVIERNRDSIISWGQFVGDTIRSKIGPVVEFVVGEFAIAEAMIMHWREVVALAVTSAALAFVRAFNIIEFWVDHFTKEIKWMADTIMGILGSMAVNAVVVFNNILTNIKGFIDAAKMAIKGEGQFTLVAPTAGTGLINFSAGGPLPELGKRVIGPIEDELDKETKRLGENLWDNILENFMRRTAPIDNFLKRMSAPAGPPELPTPANVNKPFNVNVPTPKIETFKATFEGLQDTFHRIQAAAASGRIEERQLAAAERGASALDTLSKTTLPAIAKGIEQIIQMRPWQARFS